MCKVIAIANQKGGVGKRTTCVNLGIGLARAGRKVLPVEADAQGSMAVSLGIQEPDDLNIILVNVLEKLLMMKILRHKRELYIIQKGLISFRPILNWQDWKLLW